MEGVEDKTSVPMEDQYKPPRHHKPGVETAHALVVARLETAYAAHDFKPPF
jgi:hypothetical protein